MRGPPHVYSKAASTARKICDQRYKKTFTTQSAKTGCEQSQQRGPSFDHLVKRSMNEAGTTRPSDFAVCRLIISSNRVGRRTGRSAGLASLRPDGVASPATRSGETRGRLRKRSARAAVYKQYVGAYAGRCRFRKVRARLMVRAFSSGG